MELFEMGCGIAGFYGLEDKFLLKKMCDIISHRGPNDEGFLTDKSLALGVRRLSVIDLKTGHQPIHNEDESIWLVFNGEVYNYRDLREALEKAGHNFYTMTDTETIIHAYEQYGEEFVKKLRGMFAFALWDSNRRTLYLVRDRFGKKPLYYCHLEGRFLFGSEMKAILQYEEVPRHIEQDAVFEYLLYGYVPAPKTILRGIWKLPPASVLKVTPGSREIKTYWSLKEFTPRSFSEDEFTAQLERLLIEAVKIRLRSDVPLGAFLSGGIDSSTIVGLMSRESGNQVKTFSVSFEDSDVDESRFARLVSERFKTDHHALMVSPDFVSVLPKLAWHFDEPFADSSAIPTYYISELARKHVTVALSGDGGDEVFAGYEWAYEKKIRHPRVWLAGLYKLIPGFLRERINSRLTRSPGAKSRIDNFIDAVRYFSEQPGQRYLERSTKHNFHHARLIQVLGDKSYVKQRLDSEYNRFTEFFQGFDTPNEGAWYATIQTYLPDDILVKIDRMSMAVSLECRNPFLDHQLVELVASAPFHYRLRNGTTKYALKKISSKLLPREIIERSKIGFGMPISSWFKSELSELAPMILQRRESFVERILNKAAVASLITENRSGSVDHSDRLWNLICLELWHAVYLERDISSQPRYDLHQIV